MGKYLLKAILVLSFVSSHALAARLASYCHMDEDGKNIQGKNFDSRMPIASVSKVFTSYLAARKYALGAKFTTYVHFTPVQGETDTFDVHIRGSADPYFNQYKMHMIISRLNQAGVKKIRQLSFDENVKYLNDTDNVNSRSGVTVSVPRVNPKTGKTFMARYTYNPLIIKSTLDFPAPEIVKAQLQNTKQVLLKYKVSYQLSNKDMVANPVYNPRSVVFTPVGNLKLTNKTQTLYVSSQDLETILKSMNWNSNNFSANRLLEASGGLSEFNDFYYKQLKLKDSDLKFINGSGQNHAQFVNDPDGRAYNEATCRTTLRTLRGLNDIVSQQKKQLTDIMSVVGVDRKSTVGGKTYSNNLTFNRVVAKTGTVGTHVSLAGAINTPKGLRYFMFNVALEGPRRKVRNLSRYQIQEENRARGIISIELQKLARQYGTIPFKYTLRDPLIESLENYDEDEIAEKSCALSAEQFEPIN